MDFIKRIHARIDPEIEAMGPAYRHAARVAITTRDGRQFKHEILNRRGSPENPLSHDDVVYKFRNVVESCLSKRDIDRVIALTEWLDTTEDTRELFGLLAAARPQAS
jgi:2-methylcitrate dehydratase PrpD